MFPIGVADRRGRLGPALDWSISPSSNSEGDSSPLKSAVDESSRMLGDPELDEGEAYLDVDLEDLDLRLFDVLDGGLLAG